jgi:hypothetical protein
MHPGANKAENILKHIYLHRRVTVAAARELSWRKFYYDAGGKEKLSDIDSSKKIEKLLRVSEIYFANILENKLTDQELRDIISLPPTDTWTKDGNKRIRIKRIV